MRLSAIFILGPMLAALAAQAVVVPETETGSKRLSNADRAILHSANLGRIHGLDDADLERRLAVDRVRELLNARKRLPVQRPAAPATKLKDPTIQDLTNTHPKRDGNAAELNDSEIQDQIFILASPPSQRDVPLTVAKKHRRSSLRGRSVLPIRNIADRIIIEDDKEGHPASIQDLSPQEAEAQSVDKRRIRPMRRNFEAADHSDLQTRGETDELNIEESSSQDPEYETLTRGSLTKRLTWGKSIKYIDCSKGFDKCRNVPDIRDRKKAPEAPANDDYKIVTP